MLRIYNNKHSTSVTVYNKEKVGINDKILGTKWLDLFSSLNRSKIKKNQHTYTITQWTTNNDDDEDEDVDVEE